MSNFASVTEMNTVSRVAEVSKAVPIQNVSGMIAEFEEKLEGFYAEFAEKILGDYQQMRASYMQDYQQNLDANTSRKDDRLTEVTGEIEAQEQLIQQQRQKKA